MAGKKFKTGGLQKQWGWFLALGILLMFFGFTIIIFPVAGTFAIEVLLGLLLLIGGLAHIAMAFMVRGWKGFMFTLLSGILYALVGLLLLVYPLSGVVTLTLVLGVLLLVQGILTAALAFKLKPDYNHAWLLFDGIITILLGILILVGWPSDSIWVIGLLFGINLLFSGLSSMIISFTVKEAR
ncbi:DUF308 domain-containing protein [Candidatus Micrarchaeota archaeon]|nr:DUF308 domain-containing protein [Candidatus Micrarchaeota archaeon]